MADAALPPSAPFQPLRFQGRQAARGRTRGQINLFASGAVVQAFACSLKRRAHSLVALCVGNARREGIGLQNQAGDLQRLRGLSILRIAADGIAQITLRGPVTAQLERRLSGAIQRRLIFMIAPQDLLELGQSMLVVLGLRKQLGHA